MKDLELGEPQVEAVTYPELGEAVDQVNQGMRETHQKYNKGHQFLPFQLEICTPREE